MWDRKISVSLIVFVASIVLIAVAWGGFPTNANAQQSTLSLKNKLLSLMERTNEDIPFVIHLDYVSEPQLSWLRGNQRQRETLVIRQPQNLAESAYIDWALVEVGDDYFCVSPYIDLAVSDNAMECIPFTRITSLSFTSENHIDFNRPSSFLAGDSGAILATPTVIPTKEVPLFTPEFLLPAPTATPSLDG